MVSVVGCTAPAPRPCSTRKATSIGTLVEKATEHRPEEEQAHPGDEGAPPAEPVGEPAAEEHPEGAGQQEAGEDPGVERPPVQLRGERRHRRRHHRGLEGRHHQGEEHPHRGEPSLAAGGRRLPGEGVRGLHAGTDLTREFPCRERMTRIVSLRRAAPLARGATGAHVTTDQLSAFLTLAQEKRFVSAARRLGMSQSGLSRQVQSLERELGTRLLVRTPRGRGPDRLRRALPGARAAGARRAPAGRERAHGAHRQGQRPRGAGDAAHRRGLPAARAAAAIPQALPRRAAPAGGADVGGPGGPGGEGRAGPRGADAPGAAGGPRAAEALDARTSCSRCHADTRWPRRRSRWR